MIVMVSTKTLSAREPDHRASTKPSEMMSNRPPPSTWFRVGSMTWLTARSVRNVENSSTTAWRMSWICAALKLSDT